MQLQQINRTDAEKVFITVRNMSGSAMVANEAAVLDLGTTVDGISVIDPVTASFMGWIGIVDAAIADTAYGRAQIWGYRDSVLLSHEGTSVTVTIGDPLHIVTDVTGLNTSTAAAILAMGTKYVICAETQTISAAAYCKAIIRCL